MGHKIAKYATGWKIRGRIFRDEIAVRIVACYPAKIPTMYIVPANEIQ